MFGHLRQHISIVIVEHNLDLMLALADRIFALERGAAFHEGPAAPLLADLDSQEDSLARVSAILTASPAPHGEEARTRRLEPFLVGAVARYPAAKKLPAV